METDNGISLTSEERLALNRWIYRLLCEQSGPSLPLSVEQKQRLHGSWSYQDQHKALATVSKELADRYCEVGQAFNFRSSNTWQYLGQHYPELIVACIKAGAFKEIGDEDEKEYP